jgi:hypothetical protein
VIPLPADETVPLSPAARAMRAPVAIIAAGLFLSAILAGCAPTSGGAGTTYSNSNPVFFGHGTGSPHRELGETADAAEPATSTPAAAGERPAEPEAAEQETAKATGAETTVVPIVQSAPRAEQSAPARADVAAPKHAAKPAEKKKQQAALPPVPSEADMMAARGHKPEELMGLGPDEVRRLLGNPVLVRRDAPAEIWQYRGRDCALDVYLYPPAANGKSGRAEGVKRAAAEAGRTVLYYELRGASTKRSDGEACFISLIAAALAGRPS